MNSQNSPNGNQYTEKYSVDIVRLHRDVHVRLREAISGLDGAALNWTPAPDTSSIGTIITHMLGAQAEMLRNLPAIPTNRNRSAEFIIEWHNLSDLLALIDAADRDLEQLAPRIGEKEFQTAIPRPNKPEPETGLFWLVRNYGHMREHAAQVELTRQLCENRPDAGQLIPVPQTE